MSNGVFKEFYQLSKTHFIFGFILKSMKLLSVRQKHASQRLCLFLLPLMSTVKINLAALFYFILKIMQNVYISKCAKQSFTVEDCITEVVPLNQSLVLSVGHFPLDI